VSRICRKTMEREVAEWGLITEIGWSGERLFAAHAPLTCSDAWPEHTMDSLVRCDPMWSDAVISHTMSSGLSQAALWSCASYTAFGDWFRQLSISHWSLLLFYRSWITAMPHWLASQPACLTVSSLSSTRLPGTLLDLALGAYYRCSCQFSLATSTRAYYGKFKLAVIICRAFHGAARQCTACTSLSIGSAAVRCRSSDETPWLPLLIDFQSSRRPPVAMCYCRRSVVCYCRPSTLEQSTC